MQAAAVRHVLAANRKSEDRQLDAVSDAFSTHILAAIVPGALPKNDVVPLKLTKLAGDQMVAVRGCGGLGPI
jgi:hypothetical protein